MKKYELVIIFDASLEEEETEKEISKITSLLEKEKCTISDIDRWGVRRLAYPIKKQESGYYVIIYFTGTGDIIPEVERVNRINDRVLRHMVVKSEG
ncbi:MAG: 30S ribosomal protein S6 [Actinobacteria bacterium]|nr:30S ribosomal protein S6 [Actinomycetota bacterium]